MLCGLTKEAVETYEFTLPENTPQMRMGKGLFCQAGLIVNSSEYLLEQLNLASLEPAAGSYLSFTLTLSPCSAFPCGKLKIGSPGLLMKMYLSFHLSLS